MELPIKVVTNILRFLDDQSDLFSASLVSKTWWTASRDPVLRSEVDVKINITESKQLLTKVLHLNQSKVIRLEIGVPYSSEEEKKGTVKPSRKPLESCHCTNFKSTHESTLFGVPFVTLALPYQGSLEIVFDICVYLVEQSVNLRSLQVKDIQLTILSRIDQNSRLISLLQDITDIELDVWGIETTLLLSQGPLLSSIRVQKLELEWLDEIEHLRNLSENRGGNLSICAHEALASELSEELKTFLCDRRVKICDLHISSDLTKEEISWLGNRGANIQRLYLRFGQEPKLEILEHIDSELRCMKRSSLHFPCVTLDTGDILAALSSVCSLVFKGPFFSLTLMDRHSPSSSLGIHVTLDVKQETLEPTGDSVSSVVDRHPQLGGDIRMQVYGYHSSPEMINEALSTIDGIKHLIFSMGSTRALQLPGTSKLSQLRSLRVQDSWSYVLKVDSVLRLPMPQLRHLFLSRSSLSDKGLRSLASYASDLRYLSVRSDRITHDGILAIVTNCKRLQRLNVEGCASLTQKCVAYIAEHCPTLQQLCADDSLHDRAATPTCSMARPVLSLLACLRCHSRE